MAFKVLSIKQCMVLSNFYATTWALMVLSESDETNPNAFQWDYLQGRCDLLQLCQEKFGVGCF